MTQQLHAIQQGFGFGKRTGGGLPNRDTSTATTCKIPGRLRYSIASTQQQLHSALGAGFGFMKRGEGSAQHRQVPKQSPAHNHRADIQHQHGQGLSAQRLAALCSASLHTNGPELASGLAQTHLPVHLSDQVWVVVRVAAKAFDQEPFPLKELQGNGRAGKSLAVRNTLQVST